MDRNEELYWIAVEYEDSCEAYDHRACVHENGYGIAIPLGPVEHYMVNENARNVRELLKAKYDLSHEDFQRAMKIFHELHQFGFTREVKDSTSRGLNKWLNKENHEKL